MGGTIGELFHLAAKGAHYTDQEVATAVANSPYAADAESKVSTTDMPLIDPREIHLKKLTFQIDAIQINQRLTPGIFIRSNRNTVPMSLVRSVVCPFKGGSRDKPEGQNCSPFYDPNRGNS